MFYCTGTNNEIKPYKIYMSSKNIIQMKQKSYNLIIINKEKN